MPHCIFGDEMDKSKIMTFDGKDWEKEIINKSDIKKFSKN